MKFRAEDFSMLENSSVGSRFPESVQSIWKFSVNGEFGARKIWICSLDVGSRSNLLGHCMIPRDVLCLTCHGLQH